jgi:muramoyltetrapeptide carboxypeptidase
MLVPPALCPGDLIDVVAPSSPFDRTLAWRGLGWLRQRYRVRFDRSMFDIAGYLAGNDDRRAAELDRAMRATDSKAIVAVRGGYGLHRIASRMDWEAFRAHPKWLVGFSDVTVLHVEASAAGVASMHAPMVAALGRCHEPTRCRWIDALEHPLRARRWSNLAALRAGEASGTSFGGNLTVMHACAAGGRLHIPAGAILFLEDVGERPYRVDRMLTTLVMGGHFDSVRGIVLGEFTDCYPGADRICVQDVLRDLLGSLGIPIVTQFPIGHGEDNDPLPLGFMTSLHATDGDSWLSLNG